MPELPEVETLKLFLEKLIVNHIITDVVIRRINLRYTLQEDLKLQILTSKILKLRRIAKYLILELSNDKCLIIHLGMSGRFTLQSSTYQPRKHDHVIFHLSTNKCLVYNDSRRFGMIEAALITQLKEHRFFKNLGPEPLSTAFNMNYLFNKFQRSKKPVKNILMDNCIVVGIGNIYASESLFLANINPKITSNKLTLYQVGALVTAIKEILVHAILFGGTTLKDFVGGGNQPGYFRQQLSVYSRAGKECKNCRDIILKIKQSGRASFYCPTCQKF